MTFYEAALEVLREQGEPMPADRITAIALERGLLSHTGRVPEETMQARLVAMSSRADPRQVVIAEPGVFGLAEWGIDHDEEAAKASLPQRDPTAPSLRPAERTPLTLKEARAARDAERAGRHEAEDRRARSRSRRRRRQPAAGESPADCLESLIRELGGGPLDLDWVVGALGRQRDLPEGMPSDIEGLRALAEEENARREEAGEPARFELEGDRLDLVATPEPKVESEAGPVVDEQTRQAVVRAVRDALGRVSAEAVEARACEVAEHHGVSDLKVAKRSAKGSPLFTGMLRVGVARIRVAIRVLVSGRDARVDDVDELRGDLEHYSAAAGVLVTTGKVSPQVRSRAEDNAHKPVAPFDGEAFASACVRAGVGVRRRLVETFEVDRAGLDRAEPRSAS